MRRRAAKGGALNASSRESRRCQPAEEAPGQTAAVVENDARRDGLAIWKHSNLIAHEVSKCDMRLPPPTFSDAFEAVIPGDASIEPGISRFRVWC
jgi:hypothetical protein